MRGDFLNKKWFSDTENIVGKMVKVDKKEYHLL